MTKIKVFKLDRTEEKEISDFLATVNVTQDGFLINEGVLGILYREKEDLGMDKDQMVVAASGELAKAQKQYIIQDGLVRAYSAMDDLFNRKKVLASNKKIELEKKLGAYNETFDFELEKDVNERGQKLKALEQKWKKAPKAEKPALEKQTYELSQELKPLEEKFNEIKKKFEEGKKAIEAEISDASVTVVNLAGEIKQNKGLLETALLDREHAQIFIATTKEMIEDIRNGSVEKEMTAEEKPEVKQTLAEEILNKNEQPA